MEEFKSHQQPKRATMEASYRKLHKTTSRVVALYVFFLFSTSFYSSALLGFMQSPVTCLQGQFFWALMRLELDHSPAGYACMAWAGRIITVDVYLPRLLGAAKLFVVPTMQQNACRKPACCN